jgi:RNA polymerase sigma-70 factor (ECF subfamily)
VKTEDDPQLLPLEEPALIHRAQQGDREAFAGLVERYWDRLYRWLYHLAGDRHAAEDLTQETFLKTLAGLKTFRPGSNFQAWLFRIAHNNFVNLRRSARGNRQQAFPEDLRAADEGPVEQAAHREGQRLLAQAVGRLPHEFKAAFLLRVEDDLSFREIARILGLTEETARWRVFKARQKLLAALTPQRDREQS